MIITLGPYKKYQKQKPLNYYNPPIISSLPGVLNYILAIYHQEAYWTLSPTTAGYGAYWESI